MLNTLEKEFFEYKRLPQRPSSAISHTSVCSAFHGWWWSFYADVVFDNSENKQSRRSKRRKSHSIGDATIDFGAWASKKCNSRWQRRRNSVGDVDWGPRPSSPAPAVDVESTSPTTSVWTANASTVTWRAPAETSLLSCFYCFLDFIAFLVLCFLLFLSLACFFW